MGSGRNHEIEGLLRAAAPRALAAVAAALRRLRRRRGPGSGGDDRRRSPVAGAGPAGEPGRLAGQRRLAADGRPDPQQGLAARARGCGRGGAATDPSGGRGGGHAAADVHVLPPGPRRSPSPCAVAGLSTDEIAAAFLVPEQTMAQRISRAKKTIQESGEPFAMPAAAERSERLRSVLRAIYLIFNEGYAVSAGTELARADLAAEAIRLGRIVRLAAPAEPEIGGLASTSCRRRSLPSTPRRCDPSRRTGAKSSPSTACSAAGAAARSPSSHRGSAAAPRRAEPGRGGRSRSPRPRRARRLPARARSPRRSSPSP